MTKELVSIVIVNHNGKKWLRDCFESLLHQTYNNFEIIIIDNASTDDSINEIQNSKFKIQNYHRNCGIPLRRDNLKLKIVRNEKNLGFGKANNMGVEKAKGEILFFLNNDTILEKDVLEKLLTFKANNKLNILGPRTLNYDGKDIHRGNKCSIDYTSYIGYAKKTFFIDGCALIISKEDFLNLGGFDEKYFMYSEDIDLCWRAHLYGMKVDICNATSIKHFAGGTGGTTHYRQKGDHEVSLIRRYEVEKNNLRNILKNYQIINLLWVIPLFEFQSLGECLVYLVTGNFEAIRAVLTAHLWNLSNLGDTLRKRKIIQRNRIVGDGKILSLMFFGMNKFLAFRSIGLPKFK